jgi:hypothetical protein
MWVVLLSRWSSSSSSLQKEPFMSLPSIGWMKLVRV